jgi:ferritin-like metal-binding protein YciE
MALFWNKEFNNLEDLFWAQIEDLYDAEHRLTSALPKMADASHSPQLKSAFQTHLRETENHIKRLEQVFSKAGKEPTRGTCAAMKGLVTEGDEMISAEGDPETRDAAMIAAAQRVEHYEISGYGTVRTLAKTLGFNDAARLMQTTLDEEKATDEKLTQIAESSVNLQAAHG